MTIIPPTAVTHYLRLVKFSHTIFSLPFALVGYFLAVDIYKTTWSWSLLALVILSVLFARNTAMGFNRFIDRHIDAQNERTVSREIPQHRISPKGAATFVLINAMLFIATTFFINPLCFYLSPVALLVIMGYSYAKYYTAWCHIILGIGLALSPIGAFLAVSGEFAWLPLIFSFVVLSWVSGFDIIYALQDAHFDKTHHLNSIPSFWGIKKALVISIILHSIAAIGVILPYFMHPFSWIYLLGASVFIGLLGYQHTLVKSTDLTRVNLAFFTTNGLASILFGCFVLVDLWV